MRPTFLTAGAVILLAACAPDAAEVPLGEPPAPEERTEMLPVAGTELFVRTVGSGPPVIVVHGGPVLDHGYLYPWLLPLASQHELVFYDQRLSGRSSAEAPEATITLSRFVEDIEAIRAARGYERVDLIAHSWGGLLGQLYAARHPERVRRLVLVGSMAPTSDLRFAEEMAQREAMRAEDAAAMEEVRGSEGFQQQTPEGIEAMLRASFRSGFVDASLADSLDFEIGADYVARSERFGLLFPELQSYDVTAELSNISASTLILYGDEEPGARIGGSVLAEAIPGATVGYVAGAGHFPFVERPADFLDRVDYFLDAGR